MKPFYLHGNTGMSVSLDGPALRVNAPQRAASLYPLQRISRVISSGPVEWTTPALLACAQRGITITFLSPGGTILAYLFGETYLRTGLDGRLRDLLDRPDWQERYRDWNRAMESWGRRALLKRLNPELAQLSPTQLKTLLDQTKHRYASPAVCRYLDRRLRGLLAALVTEQLSAVGLSAERLHAFEGRLNLVEDVVELLAWDLYLPVLELLQRRHGAPIRLEDAALVRLFEARSRRLQRLGRSLLNRLHGWLVELS